MIRTHQLNSPANTSRMEIRARRIAASGRVTKVVDGVDIAVATGSPTAIETTANTGVHRSAIDAIDS